MGEPTTLGEATLNFSLLFFFLSFLLDFFLMAMSGLGCGYDGVWGNICS